MAFLDEGIHLVNHERLGCGGEYAHGDADAHALTPS